MCLRYGSFNLRMSAHSKIIIAAPDLNAPLAPTVFIGCREIFSISVDLFKDAIRMVHFLLQYLTLEKVLVLKSLVAI